MSYNRQDHLFERFYKSLWHIFIVGVGVYEFKVHKTKAAKVLAAGMIAFHVDGAVADILDTKPLSRRILEGLQGVPKDEIPSPPSRIAYSRRRIR